MSAADGRRVVNDGRRPPVQETEERREVKDGRRPVEVGVTVGGLIGAGVPGTTLEAQVRMPVAELRRASADGAMVMRLSVVRGGMDGIGPAGRFFCGGGRERKSNAG